VSRTMPDRTDEFIRLGMEGLVPPRPGATAVADIMRHVQNSERLRERLLTQRGTQSKTRRFALAAYWGGSAMASAWILWQLPWPQQMPSIFAEHWAWLAPALSVVLLSGSTLTRWLNGIRTRLFGSHIYQGGRS
jgi:hypothetical protein